MSSSRFETRIVTYDTTLRDGAQQQGVNFTVAGKIEATKLLDNFGLHYIEGGWPGSNNTDTEFFQRMRDEEEPLKRAKFAAFGSTRRAGILVENDPGLQALIEARTPVITLVGKSSLFQVKEVLQTTPEENLRMIEDSIRLLKVEGIPEVIFDAEHFFDGYKYNAEYTLETIRTAAKAGADWIALCDTNGGTLPIESVDSRTRKTIPGIQSIVRRVMRDQALHEIYRTIRGISDKTIRMPIGIHTHDDLHMADANSLIAVAEGATQIQGAVNGFGERLGNANILNIMLTRISKMNDQIIDKLVEPDIKSFSQRFFELAGAQVNPNIPYVGDNAAAHKAGLHTSGIARNSVAYEHERPERFGNSRRFIISELSGKATFRAKLEQLNLPFAVDEDFIGTVSDEVKRKVHEGYNFEEAEASFELLVHRLHKSYQPPFDVKIIENDGQVTGSEVTFQYTYSSPRNPAEVFPTSRTIQIPASRDMEEVFAKMKDQLSLAFPVLADVQLCQQDIRSNNHTLTRAIARTAHSSENGQWTTVGASGNPAKAVMLAVSDALEYAIYHKAS